MVRSPMPRSPTAKTKLKAGTTLGKGPRGKASTARSAPVQPPLAEPALAQSPAANPQAAKASARKAPRGGAIKANGRPGKPERRTTRRMKPAAVDAFFQRLSEVMPLPKSELEYINPYTLLVAVVLSAQATDVGVNKATKALFATVTTPAQMVALGLEGLIPHIKTIGLFNTKAKNVIELSRQLIERHGGQVPCEREALEQLPGVGRKTANVVLNVAFGEPTIAVDTHVFRVSNRTGLAPGDTPLAVELGLLKAVPERWKDHAHHWLILHGRYTCVARKPKCPECRVKDLCLFPGKTTLA